MNRERLLSSPTALLALLALAGLLLTTASCSDGGGERAPESEEVAATEWTCSMHPQVRQDGPGDCPLCGMDLIPVEREVVEDFAGERVLSFSEAGLKLMEVDTAPVRRMEVAVQVDMVGRVTHDESRVTKIAAWVAGRIERLHADYLGFEVRRGEPLLDLYGPDLVAAQEELVQSSRAYEAARASDNAGARETTLAVLKAARRKLSLWGLSDRQIADIEAAGASGPVLTILAPAGGTVIEKNVSEGEYVRVGQTLLTVADLSRVWVELEAYESDLIWLSEGAPIHFSVEAAPGAEFAGRISFVEPVVDPETRTVAVRAEVDNTDGLLRPDMFVRASATAAASGDGGRAPLVIPATAPLITGKRAVVYVQVEGEAQPTFEGREVVLGARAGDYYVVESGLAEGERVVVEGAFKIDSALQIQARQSMMSPEASDGESRGPAPASAGHRH
jgi:Cu(I)/Ag(I) efflux system membrane fusion protein